MDTAAPPPPPLNPNGPAAKFLRAAALAFVLVALAAGVAAWVAAAKCRTRYGGAAGTAATGLGLLRGL